MRKLVGRALVGLVTTAMTAALLAPVVAASPIGDAEAAIMAAWDKAGGQASPLGARKGDVYPVGDGFALDFDGGKMFYTAATGAKYIYGPILDKYESLGGPAGSDLGFPTIDEVAGLAGPDSRVSTFSASDKPVIFWTPDHGAFVVRAALNAAWDKLGSSGGVLGVPVGDETYDGEVISQKFSGGQVSWNRDTKQFTTEPAGLADQLKGLQVPIDPTAAINMAWRAAGGASGPLGVQQGGQYPIGGDGVAQNFAGGKVFFSPATGANAVESDILAKYESLGGPVGSDLGFPVANESDGGIPSSRICTFSAADNPVIFWTAGHGAFVVRGAMKAAWAKLRGPSGKLGAPVGDQAVDGAVVSQRFTGGTISWDRAKNTFSTDPSNLAPLLSGLQVSGQKQPSTAATPARPKKSAWQRWWLPAAIPVLVLLALLVSFGARRRRSGAARYAAPGAEPSEPAYDAAAEGHWDHDDGDPAAEQLAYRDANAAGRQPLADPGPGIQVSWGRGVGAAAGLAEQVARRDPYGERAPSGSEEDEAHFEGLGDKEENPDTVDTDSIPVVTRAALSEAGHPGDRYDNPVEGAEHPVDTADIQDDAQLEDGGCAEPGHAEVAVPHTAPDVAFPEVAVIDPDDSQADIAGAMASFGRHAAMDAAETGDEEPAAPVTGGGPGVGRPTIHLPMDDPYQVPDGYPIKASTCFGLYYTPDNALYQDTLAEVWLSSEDIARANGFIKAD